MKNMKKRERIEAALSGGKVDRPPVCLWRHWPGDDQDAEEFAQSTLKFQEDFDWDFIKVMPEVDYAVSDWGVESKWLGNHLYGARTWGGATVRDPDGPQNWGKRVIQQPEDWLKLKPLDPGKGKLSMIPKALKIIKKEVGDEVPFIQTIFSPLVQAWLLAGEERLWGHMRQYPDALKAGLKTIAETNMRLVDAVKESGASGIFYSLHHATYTLLSRDEYEEFGSVNDIATLKAAAAEGLWFRMLHLHENNVMFDLARNYPVEAINWHDQDTPPSLKDALQLYKGAVVGGVSFNRTILLGTPEDVRNEVRASVQQTEGYRHIIGCGCCIPITTPIGNIRALRSEVGKLVNG